MARKRQISVSELYLDFDLHPNNFYTAKKQKTRGLIAQSSHTTKQHGEETHVLGGEYRASISPASPVTMLGDEGRQLHNVNINIYPCPEVTTTVSYRGNEIFINMVPRGMTPYLKSYDDTDSAN